MFYTVFDIETTGFDGNICDVVQFAYANLDENFNCIKAESLYFYHDDMHWSKEAEEVHHLSREFLSQYKYSFETNIKKMFIILSRANVVTFNGDHFDIPFCNSWLKRFGFPDVVPNRSYDVMKIYQPVFKKRVKLVTLPERIGLSPDIIGAIAKGWFGYEGAAHDAAYDVTMTALGFSHAIHKGYVYDDSKVSISIDEQQMLSNSLWNKDVFEEADFSSMTCYVIEDESGKYIVNICSDKDTYVFAKIPMSEYKEVIYSDKFRDKLFPVAFINNVIKAVETGVVFKGSNGLYSCELAPGITAKIDTNGQQCKFII